MKKDLMPVPMAAALVVVGIFLGSVFTFGMQFWNADVERSDCKRVETQVQSFREIRQGRGVEVKEIAIECLDGQRYFIDGVSVNDDLTEALSELLPQEEITLLVHPNSSTILEFTGENARILEFDTTMKRLKSEAKGFAFLGIFLYLCALDGCYHLLQHWRKRHI